ncbi:MAG: hydrogenase maturation protease [Actinomycetota bacterium]
MPRVRIVGCGNLDAGDDAAGLVAVDRVRSLVPPDVDVVTAPTALHVLDLLEGVDTVLLVDAMRTTGGGREPGHVVRAESGPEGLPATLRSSLSSHGLGLAEAVGLAAALGPVPRVVFLGVEVGDVRAGRGLSPAVDAALPALVDAIVREAGGGT